jgi:hypothetical protein
MHCERLGALAREVEQSPGKRHSLIQQKELLQMSNLCETILESLSALNHDERQRLLYALGDADSVHAAAHRGEPQRIDADFLRAAASRLSPRYVDAFKTAQRLGLRVQPNGTIALTEFDSVMASQSIEDRMRAKSMLHQARILDMNN